MKITDIEVIPIHPRIAGPHESLEIRFAGIQRRTVWKVHTDGGLVGYGDHRGSPPPQPNLESLIGRDPFDFIGNTFDPGLGGALYDVMGKYLEVPAYKLMGQKVRDAVAVAAWTPQASPEELGRQVRRAALQGYASLKMHTAPFFDVVEQTRAVEAAAPEGFRIHYDFNGSRTLAAALPVVRELEQHPIVGYIEDPFPKSDLDSWRRLREQTRIPIAFHIPAGHRSFQEVLSGAADAYLISGAGIGDTLASGVAYSRANIQTLIQLTGGTLAKALALHIAAVLPTATGHSINLDDQYEEDVVRERIPVVEGYSSVPEGPGLGVEVDAEMLARVAANKPMEVPRHIGILRLPGDHRLYTRSVTQVTQLTGREEGTVRGIRLELREDDGSLEFERLYERVEREETFVE